MDAEGRLEKLEQACRLLLEAIGEDLEREGLRDTPARFAHAWLREWGATVEREFNPSDMTVFADPNGGHNELIFQGPIPYWSMCEHHLAPFFGSAYIAYLPRSNVIGLSKLSRIVAHFARRPQIQERLTKEIAVAISATLFPLALGVVLKARHSCMESRGICKSGIWTTTSCLRGEMLAGQMRNEFFAMVNMAETRG